MNHFATPGSWFHGRRLSEETRALADRSFAVLQVDEEIQAAMLFAADMAEDRFLPLEQEVA